MTKPAITSAHIAKFLALLDEHGLTSGLGKPEPGKMCIEATWCYVLDLPHGDDPQCVAESVRQLKIRLNDANWSTNAARAKGLRRLGVAQIGSKGALDEKEFVQRCSTLAIQTCVPNALRAAASMQKPNSEHRAKLLAAADLCEREPTRENACKARSAAADAAAYAAAAYAADAAAYSAAAAAAYAAAADARDKALADYCEGVVKILIDMKAPGCQWLSLTEAA